MHDTLQCAAEILWEVSFFKVLAEFGFTSAAERKTINSITEFVGKTLDGFG